MNRGTKYEVSCIGGPVKNNGQVGRDLRNSDNGVFYGDESGEYILRQPLFFCALIA